jgi:hypothetical protein
MIQNGIIHLDFNSFPLIIKEIPPKPNQTELRANWLDAIYNRSTGGISPSGWKCKNLPYLVEFDNFGKVRSANLADTT